MSIRRAKLAATLCMVLLLSPFSGAPVAQAQGDDFARFCTQWMQKLAQRERDNLQHAQARPADTGVMLEYVGYGTEVLRCEPRVPKPGRPGVGIMVYHELKYRRQGADSGEARGNTPSVLARVEVTEVFKFDGSRWVY